MTRKIRLPPPVAAIYRAVTELEALYPGRRFTPDGHLVGSIGEVVAAEALGLTLYPMSHAAQKKVSVREKGVMREKGVRNLFSPR